PEWLYLFAGAVTLSAVGFVFVAVTWLHRLRETVSVALAEAAGQQIRTSQRLGDAIAEVRKQQDSYARQLQVLAQAELRLQQEISSVSHRLDTTLTETVRSGQTLH
ncbi:MAG: hypothetical protein KGI97_00975, partial [Alphaproteobacteria bacterium]|nr:hypothetical protein [Alphaproteobacteria bacterium]